MSMREAHENLVQLLNDSNNAVIALVGKWGTGKSHLWTELRKSSSADWAKKSVTVSLFGAKSISELKLKILHAFAEESIKNPTLKQKLTKSIHYGAAKLSSFSNFFRGTHKALELGDPIALLAAPSLLKDLFVVVDDIERKHKDLDIKEVLAFIEEAKINSRTRFLLILNSDELEEKDKDSWKQLREKVIDHELTLEISPSEAFDVASEFSPTRHAPLARTSAEICKINNIRILRKILRALAQLLDHRADLHKNTLSRVIPSTTLLAAIHYGGIEDGPTVDFVVGFNDLLFQMSVQTSTDANIEEQEKIHKEAGWADLLRTLGISLSDEYEVLVRNFLVTGLVPKLELDGILDRYSKETAEQIAHNLAKEYIENAYWRQDITNEELLHQAGSLVPQLKLIDLHSATGIIEVTRDLEGGEALADAMIAACLSEMDSRSADEKSGQRFPTLGANLLPIFAETIKERHLMRHPGLPLEEIGRRLYERKDRIGNEGVLLVNSTPGLFIDTIKRLTGEDLRDFIKHYIDAYCREDNYREEFGGAMENFAEACKILCARAPSSRLAKILRRAFANNGLPSFAQKFLSPPILSDSGELGLERNDAA